MTRSGLPKGLLCWARAHSPNISYWRNSQTYTSSTSPPSTISHTPSVWRQPTPPKIYAWSRYPRITCARSRRGARCASQRVGKATQYSQGCWLSAPEARACERARKGRSKVRVVEWGSWRIWQRYTVARDALVARLVADGSRNEIVHIGTSSWRE
jgi:hypothetical protein